jgi:paraquat-inducible protein A
VISESVQTPQSTRAITACPGCDLLVLEPAVPDGHYLACGRCGKVLSKAYENSIHKVLALSFTGLLLYIPAMFLPLMTLSSLGIKEKSNVIETAHNFFLNGYYLVALIVFVTAVLVPFLKLFLPFVAACALRLGKTSKPLRSAFRFLKHLEEWGMVEVYLLGILITLIKMGDVASIDFNLGFYCFIALVLISMAATVSLDNKLFWHYLDTQVPHPGDEEIERITSRLSADPRLMQTAAQLGLMRCHDCGRLISMSGHKEDHAQSCPRCGSAMHFRTASSVVRTWALVITSIILFFPANMLPIMEVEFLGIPDRSTILDGILYFLKEGSFGIGLIIFVASILVPLFKIIGMLIILLSIRSGKKHYLRQKAKMFRFIEFIGRWSMLDIFVVALLTVLVDFGFLTSMHTAPGATYFCAVVVATMTAAIIFDPRILWDRCDPLKPSR